MLPQWLRKTFAYGLRRQSRRVRRRPTARLSLEHLEDRLAPALVAAYGFNEGSGTTTADASGNGNTATLVNATWTTAGKYGDALSFNGTNARVNIPNSTSLELTTGMTLEAWVNPSTVTSAWRDVIYKGNDNYFLEATSTTSSRPGGGATLGTADVVTTGTAALAASTWSYLTLTYNGSSLILYVNGTQVSTLAHTGNILTSTSQLQIGGDSIFGQFFKGTIDEVRVYNTALTAAQITTDMNTPIAPDTQPPTQPTNLMATPVSPSQINLSWTASSDNVGVTGYYIYRENPGTTTFTKITEVTATSYSDMGLAASSTYSYEVQATDAAGNLSPFSSPPATTTTLTADTQPPTQPGNLMANAVSEGQINLSWTASTDNVGVTGYYIYRENPGATSFTKLTEVTTTTYSDSGLIGNSTYSYEVQATDAAGNLSQFSSPATTTTLATFPGLVASYSFNEGSGTTVNDSSGNGNNGTISNATWTTAGKYSGALLFNGTNATVNIPDSASLNLTTALTLEAWVDPSSVTKAWRDVIYKGNDAYYLEGTSGTSSGAPAGGATVGSADVDTVGTAALTASTWAYLTLTYNGSSLILYVNGVQVSSLAHTGSILNSANALQIGGDSIYGQFFQGIIDEVRVYNVALTAGQIATDMITPIAPAAADTQPPTMPTNLKATAVSQSQINLGWTASTDNVGVTGYLIYRENPGSSTYTQIGTSTTTTYSDTGLAASTPYSYEVRATDAAGNLSPYSLPAGTTTLAPDTQPPTMPTNLAATAASVGQINLSWTPSTDNVGVTGYLIQREAQGAVSFVQVGTTAGTTYSDTGLSPNTTYVYQVQATDAAGNLSAFSTAASTATLPTKSGLVAAYSFSEGSGTTVGDSSGNGHTGTISNATWTASGKFGAALVFNGKNALVTIPDTAALNLTTGMTLEAWVNPSATPTLWADVIYKGPDNYYIEGTSQNVGEPAAGATVGSSGANAFSPDTLPVNTWSYLAATYDGSTLRFYVNGVPVYNQSLPGSLATSTDPLQIGGDSLYGQYFAGMIDEVRVYNVPLSEAEIQADMNTPITNLTQDTQAPTAPGNLLPSATGNQVGLSWTASTDNVGVTGYDIYRLNPGASSYVEIATTTATTYTDAGLTGDAAYSYKVQATDAAGNLSQFSSIMPITTSFGINPHVVELTAAQTEQFAASNSGVTWAVNGIVGGSAAVGTITATGLYTAPSTAGTYTVTATIAGPTQSDSATVYVSSYAGTDTFHNDNSRSGANLNETVLTPANVNSTDFGQLASYQLDGEAIASPLYVANVNISGKGIHNVVYVETENDSVYAFDADGLTTTPLWHDSFINRAAGITPVPANDTGETGDIPNEIGITGTPVIDPTTGTMYFVTATKDVSGGVTTYVQELHAIDITTGAEKFGGPVVIQATVPGTGQGSVGGKVSFDSLRENQRTALLLLNGVVYFGFSSHGDVEPYYGWFMGYNATTLKQVMVFNAGPNSNDNGIWMDGDGPATDSSGDVFFITGDGTFDANTGGVDYGDSFIKLSPSGSVADYFTPSVQTVLDAGNLDLGSGGLLLLPTQSGPYPDEMVSAGKNGTIYLVNRDSLGHYNPNTDADIQSLVNIFPNNMGQEGGNFSSPVYFNETVYFAPVGGPVQAFQLNNGLLTTSPTSESSEIYNVRGGTMAVSADGSSNGILWTVQSNGITGPGVLHAYLASNLGTELYNSSQAGTRDALDDWFKFSVPLVANGKVYVSSLTQLTIFGLLPNPDPPVGGTLNQAALLGSTSGGSQLAPSTSGTGSSASQSLTHSTLVAASFAPASQTNAGSGINTNGATSGSTTSPSSTTTPTTTTSSNPSHSGTATNLEVVGAESQVADASLEIGDPPTTVDSVAKIDKVELDVPGDD